MADGFDAYHKWLSIPPQEQPPNHYRLLGLGLFESDLDVIQAAADRQMAHVQTYKNGPHADLSQKLLNEIAAAKLCLLKPERRKTYDEQLRQKLDGGALGSAVKSKPTGSPAVVARPFEIESDDDGRMNRRFATLLVGGSIAIFLLLVGIGIYLLSGHGSQVAANENGKSDPSGGVTTGPVAPPTDPQPTVTPPVASPTPAPPGNATTNPPDPASHEAKVVPPPPPTNPPSPGAATTPGTDTKKPPEANPSPTVSPDKQPPDKNPPVKNPPDKVADKNPPGKNPPDATPPGGDPAITPAPKQPVKIPVPDETALADAQKRFAETPASGDAADLLSMTKHLNNPALVYVVLNKCVDQAAATGEVATAMKALDELEARYLMNILPPRVKALVELRRHLSAPPDFQTLANLALGLEEQTVAAGRADLSLVLLETAVSAARKSGDLDVIRRATLRVVKFQRGANVAAKEGG